MAWSEIPVSPASDTYAEISASTSSYSEHGLSTDYPDLYRIWSTTDVIWDSLGSVGEENNTWGNFADLTPDLTGQSYTEQLFFADEKTPISGSYDEHGFNISAIHTSTWEELS